MKKVPARSWSTSDCDTRLRTFGTTVSRLARLLALIVIPGFAQTWESAIVHHGEDGKLVYVRDAEGNRVPDFSYAGYAGGGVPIPVVDVVKTISPVPGDNTENIQKAIDEVGAMPLDARGLRGALLLSAGTYEIVGTVRVNHAGVTLRGAGDGNDPSSNTILIGKGDAPHQRSIIIAGGGNETNWKERVKNSATNIIRDTVFVGSRSFQVENGSKFSAGDNIIIYHPCTVEWLKAINYGGVHPEEPGSSGPWKENSQPIVYNRFVTAVQGNSITVDAPVFSHLIRNQSQSFVYKYTRAGLLTNIGVERLRVDIETKGHTDDVQGDENHAWNAIELTQIEDSWIRNCTALHFGHAGFMTHTATRVTIDSCRALDPVSIITGERRYNFDMSSATQQILVEHCYAQNGRHHFISNGASLTSGCVFLDCTSKGMYAASEGHRRWSTGILYDNLAELDAPRKSPIRLGLYNRGTMGTSHGWATAHSVAWNCNVGAGVIVVQKPPTAQNYAIGCIGSVTGKKPPAPFSEPEGYIEGTGKTGLNPRSLYLKQLAERLHMTGKN